MLIEWFIYKSSIMGYMWYSVAHRRHFPLHYLISGYFLTKKAETKARATEKTDTNVKEKPVSKKDEAKPKQAAPKKDEEKQKAKFPGILKMFDRKSPGK